MGGQVLKELVGHPKALAFTRKPLESFDGRKVMTDLDSIFKSRDITLPTKVHLVKELP